MEASPSRKILRGLTVRCPRCGGRKLFASWFRLKPRCPTCGLRIEREEGFWLGGFVINFGTGEAFLLILLGVLIGFEANGSKVDAWPFIIIGLAIALLGPVLTFPMSRTLWLAIDLIMRPMSSGEVIDAQDDVARGEFKARREDGLDGP
jgi:uncharacterized protein (DUF983 family)